MALNFQETDTAAPLGVIQACSPVAPSGDADAREAVVGGTAGVTAVAAAIPNATKVTAYADELRIADDDTLAGGTYVHRLNVSTAQGNLTLEDIYVCRVNSSGVSQETLGSATALGTDISAGGVFTTNITLSAASAHNAGDRVYVTVAVANSHDHTSRSLEILPNQIHDTPFTSSGTDLVEIISETENVDEVLARALGLNRILSETENVSETVVRAGVFARIIDEALNLSETLVSKIFRPLEVIVVVLGRVKEHNEAVNFAETLARSRVMNRIRDEVLNVVETLVSVRGFVKLITETVNVSEIVVRAKSLIRRVAETLQISEVLASVRGLVRSRSEAINLAEQTGLSLALVRTLGETVQISENVVDVLAAVGAALVEVSSETVNLAETTVRSAGLRRILAEALNIVEVLASARELVRLRQDSLELGEQVGLALVLVRIHDETLNIAESVVDVLAAIGVALVEILNETLNLNEARLRLKGLNRIVTEVQQIAETLFRVRTLARIVDETINLVETISKPSVILQVVSETLNIGEALTQRFGTDIVKVVRESFSIIRGGFARLVADNEWIRRTFK